MRITEADRVAARAGREQKRKMSARSVTRLREMIAERQRHTEAEQKILAAFNLLRKDHWTMRQVLERLSRPVKQGMSPEELNRYYDRRVLKLRRCLAMGWKLSCVSDVRLFAALTREEEVMSDDRFYEMLTANWPVKPQRREDAKRPSRYSLEYKQTQMRGRYDREADAEIATSI